MDNVMMIMLAIPVCLAGLVMTLLCLAVIINVITLGKIDATGALDRLAERCKLG